MITKFLIFFAGAMIGLITMALAAAAGDAERCEDCLRMREEIMMENPSIERPDGFWKWVRTVKTNSCPEHWLKCSVCGKHRIIKMGEAMPDYCENCGARMNGADDE